MRKYEFKYKDMEFSKDGQLDELIALDRYAVTTHEGYLVGHTVVAIVDESTKKKSVGTIVKDNQDGTYDVETRLGEVFNVKESLLQLPLEVRPEQMWSRWAKAGASVEKTKKKQESFEDDLRELFDGYGYSLGGRIQLMLGQEHVTGKRANLTAYNCFVGKTPTYHEDSVKQFLDVIEVAFYEASIMRRGGGVGLNISTINTVSGSGAKSDDFIFYLDKNHEDHNELLDRKMLGKLNGITIVTDEDEYHELTKKLNVHMLSAIDSVDGLFENLADMVNNSYSNLKVAINFNDLRHRNALVKGVNGRSSGSVSWMELFVLIARLLQKKAIDAVDFAEIFSEITNLIEQGGSRRGALMIICNVDNENIYKFMERKKTAGFLSGANISVGVDDEFMRLVMIGKDNIANNKLSSSVVKEKLRLWDTLIQSAWSSAEPGIVWMERYNKESNSHYFHEIVATNPCGEQGLPQFGVCNLGHFVLPTFYDKELNDVDWTKLEKSIRTAVRLQDNIIDYTDYFLEENREVQMSERRVGIGSLGAGTLLIHMKLAYGSDEGNAFLDKLYKFIAKTAYDESMNLSEEKGSFPKYNYIKFKESGFMKKLLEEFPELDEKLKRTGIRNVTLLTQAPTGSTGTYIDNIPAFREEFGGTTTGIEPYFSWEYWRAGRLGTNAQTVPLALDYMKENGLKDVSELPDYYVTANDLKPMDHVKVQAVIQKWTDSSISKTANCPNDFTIEQTDELYLEAYKLGLKGMTIYRDGSREAQVLSSTEEGAKLESHIEAEKLAKMKEEDSSKLVVDFVTDGKPIPTTGKGIVMENSDIVGKLPAESMIKKVPSRLFGMREKVRYQAGDKMSKAYIHIYTDDEGTPVEVWIEPTDVHDKDMADALGRMTTQFLRFGATADNVEQTIKHLKAGKMMMSLPAIVGRLLGDIHYGKIEMPTFGKSDESTPVKKSVELAICSECGAKAYDKGNCICGACGQSKCN